jgi:hypothetical protein
MPTPLDPVRIIFVYADGKSEYTARMSRWYADWILANEVATGFYKGRRVLRALIVPA